MSPLFIMKLPSSKGLEITPIVLKRMISYFIFRNFLIARATAAATAAAEHKEAPQEA